MKVICITHKNFSGYPLHDIPKPDIGDEVTVIAESYYRDVPTYILAEYHPYSHFDRRWFARPSDIDETQLARERELAKTSDK